MAIAENIKTLTARIGGEVFRGRFYNIAAGTGLLTAPSALGDALYLALEGVSTAEYDSGDGQNTIAVAQVGAGGKAVVEAGLAITVGAVVSTLVDGRATGAAGVQLGVALEAAGAAGEFITIALGKEGA